MTQFECSILNFFICHLVILLKGNHNLGRKMEGKVNLSINIRKQEEEKHKSFVYKKKNPKTLPIDPWCTANNKRCSGILLLFLASSTFVVLTLSFKHKSSQQSGHSTLSPHSSPLATFPSINTGIKLQYKELRAQ